MDLQKLADANGWGPWRQKSESEEEWEDTAWVRAMYFSIVTLTTVGFGDLVARSDEGKVYDVVFMLVGIPLFARALAKFTMIDWSSDDADEMKLNFVIGLNKDKLNSMLDFERELARIGYGNKVDGQISRFEFLAFILVRNDVVSMEVLRDIMSNFDELDRTNTGMITVRDV